MKHKLIYLEWEDAVTNNVGWMAEDEAKEWAKEKFGLIRECGWVLEENKEFLVLSNRMSAVRDPEFGDPDVGGIHKIPKTWIRKRRVLDPDRRQNFLSYLIAKGGAKKYGKKTKKTRNAR